MKKKISTTFIVFVCVFIGIKSNAQLNWGNFPILMQQLTNTERNSFNQNLSRLNRDFDPRSFNFGVPITNLNIGIKQGNPASGLSDFSPEWQAAGSDLNRTLQGSNLNSADQSSITDAFNQLSGTWKNMNQDIKNSYDARPANTQITAEIPTRINQTDYQIWSTNQTTLQNNLKISSQSQPAKGLGNFNALFKELTKSQSFRNIEFWGGVQQSEVQYYNIIYNKSLPVIGISSVEQFISTWEARWKGQVSFERNSATVNATEVQNIENNAFNPLFYYAEFSMMYTAFKTSFSRIAGVRLISLLGIDIGTYAPAHRTVLKPNNKGNATGYGPKLGCGFSAVSGSLTAFALGTLAYGEVVCPGMANDVYSSYGLEAGLRFTNRFSIRYEMKNTRWTDGAFSRIKNGKSHQLTLGLPINNILSLRP